jgi:CRP-like cAMP-binding protein
MLYPAPQNLLLRAVSSGRQRKMAEDLTHVAFKAGRRFWKANESITHVLFPLRGVISLQLSPRAEKHVEIALVGFEGFTDVGLFLGADHAGTEAVALTEGEAFAMTTDKFQDVLREVPFQQAVSRYLRSYLKMVCLRSLCNRVHRIEDVCVTRLLQLHDRTSSSTFEVTQDVWARTLGVRRASISRAAAGLVKQGAIAYDGRGRLLLHRNQLETLACSCYLGMKTGFDGLLTINS